MSGAYEAHWRRPGEDEVLVCSGLTLRQMLARLIQAVRTNGHIELHAVTQAKEAQS